MPIKLCPNSINALNGKTGEYHSISISCDKNNKLNNQLAKIVKIAIQYEIHCCGETVRIHLDKMNTI